MRCVFPATAANAATSKANRIAGNQECCRIYCLAGGRAGPSQSAARLGDCSVEFIASTKLQRPAAQFYVARRGLRPEEDDPAFINFDRPGATNDRA